MATWTFSQYQVKTEAPPGAFSAIARFESAWHYPWSEPVRFKQDPRASVALIASGPFAPVLTQTQIIDGFESRWHYPWSEPVRFKQDPKASIALAASGPFAPVLDPDTEITNNFESRWHYPWSEPVRFKPAVLVANQPFIFYQPAPPETFTMPWFAPLSEPVRMPKRLPEPNQQFISYSYPKPLVSFSYYNWLSEPVRQRPGLGAALQPFQFFIVPQAGERITYDKWGYQWSEPIWLDLRASRLKTHLQMYGTNDPYWGIRQPKNQGYIIT